MFLFVTACSMDKYAEENRKEFNCTQWYNYLKPKQLIIKDCARRFVLKLYRHEASCGLFATAELLVSWIKKRHVPRGTLLPILVILPLFVFDLWAIGPTQLRLIT